MTQQPVIDFSAMLGIAGNGMPPINVGHQLDAESAAPCISPTAERAAAAMPAIPHISVARSLLGPFRAKAGELGKKAAGIVVNSNEAQVVAVALAGEVKKALKKIEDARKGYVGPFNEHVKEVNALATEIKTPLERAEGSLKRQLGSYAAQQELERRKAEEKARQDAAAEQARLNAEAQAAGVEAPIVPEVVVPASASAVRTASGTSYMRSSWGFEVVKLADVPLEYLTLDEQKVRAAIKAGTRNIPGLSITEQKNVAIRS